MKKWSICGLAVILILSIPNDVIAQKLSLLKTTKLSHYPSASTLEFYNDHLYVIGDDAPRLLILDKEHKVLDSILLFQTVEARINKDEKADIEASVRINEGGKNYLLAFSSFSSEKRNKILSFDLDSKELQINDAQLSHLAVPELNIEGAAWISGRMILSNRANNSNRLNHLIVAGIDTAGKLDTKDVKIISLLLPKSKKVTGISGLVYLEEKDILLFTASTENTSNATSDGAIGESFIGYIPRIEGKLKRKKIKADKLISLSKVLASKAPQKIESLAIEHANGNELILHLAADNDNGESTLFKMKMIME